MLEIHPTPLAMPSLTMPSRVMLLALVFGVCAACGSPSPQGTAPNPGGRASSSDLAAWREELMQADREFAKAFSDRGVDGWVSFFDPQGVQMPGGAAAAWGREDIETLARRLFEAPSFTSLTWEPVYAMTASSGDLGYTLGNYLAKGTGPEGDELQQEGHYVTVWRRQEDGSWKVVLDTGNSGPPLRVPAGWR